MNTLERISCRRASAQRLALSLSGRLAQVTQIAQGAPGNPSASSTGAGWWPGPISVPAVRSVIANPRIEHGVQDVDEQVGDR